MKTVNEMIDTILKHEGGFVNDPDDRGGATNWGITERTYGKFLGRSIPQSILIDLIEHMPQHTARMIYKEDYYYYPKIDMLDEYVQPVVFDMAVNHGPDRAVRILQRAINQLMGGQGRIVEDGKIGPNTSGMTSANEIGIVEAICNERAKFYRTIATNNPRQSKFLNGWLKRCESFRP